MSCRIDVIATTISGSVKDWGKVKRIVPLFEQHGETDVHLYALDSHREARRKTAEVVGSGARTVISAGGSGTFNAVLEGCFDSGIDLKTLRFGFLRKGSADLIGKTLGMPDDIEQAIEVFVKAIRENRTVPCDVIRAVDGANQSPPRRFVGYGGAEVFGRIPHYTENRFIKYYKGILGQIFGDLGPFSVGTSLAVMEKVVKSPFRRKRSWKLQVDGKPAAEGHFQAIIIVNGDLGPDLPFARSEKLGSGKFYAFTLRDLGATRLPGQLKRVFDTTITRDPQKWGFESFTIDSKLVIEVSDGGSFPVNTDGSTMICTGRAEFAICDQLHLLST